MARIDPRTRWLTEAGRGGRGRAGSCAAGRAAADRGASRLRVRQLEVDLSNVQRGTAALLPRDPDRSARRIRDAVVGRTGMDVGIVVSDTFGRPWRLGHRRRDRLGLRAVMDLRGSTDALGRELQVTEVAVADEGAAAAELVMGKSTNVPVAIVREPAAWLLAPDRASRWVSSATSCGTLRGPVPLKDAPTAVVTGANSGIEAPRPPSGSRASATGSCFRVPRDPRRGTDAATEARRRSGSDSVESRAPGPGRPPQRGVVRSLVG
ncbi:MAG: coenzyme F420-0:L-glutamate ligase [Microthrixaceae bacterium]